MIGKHVMKFVLFTVILSLFASVDGVLLTTNAQSDSSTNIAPGHIVIAIEGEAEIHRATWSDAGVRSVLNIGTIVLPNDIIEVQPGGQVDVLCANLQLDRISSVSRAPQCSNNLEEAVIVWDGVPIIKVQLKNTSTVFFEIPYLVTPRDTNVLTNQPRFEWAPLSSAATYSIQLIADGGSEVWVQRDLATNSMEYLDGAAPLAPGRYIIAITPFEDNGNEINIAEDPYPNSFVVPENETIDDIIEGINNMRDSMMSDGASDDLIDYSVALYLANHGFYSDAIVTLKALLPVDIIAGDMLPETLPPETTLAGSPELYLRLGDYYQLVHLPLEAWLAYEAGLQIAEEQGDEASIAWARAGLAEVVIGNSVILEHYEAALVFYEDAGDVEIAHQLEEKAADYR